jgi:very-short-patch-repair endonuclease
MTEPERRPWRQLRARLPVAGSHFRRQVALGGYVVDFCCLSPRLVIEVDGGQHGFEADAAYDERRTRSLEAQGFRVLRFSNAEAMRSIDSVLDTIFSALNTPHERAAAHPAAGVSGRTSPTSNSSPQGGGGYAPEP